MNKQEKLDIIIEQNERILTLLQNRKERMAERAKKLNKTLPKTHYVKAGKARWNKPKLLTDRD